MINIIKSDRVVNMKNPHGVSVKKLHDSEQAVIITITLWPGEKLKKHITPVDVCFYVLEGNGVVEIGDERAEVSSHMLIESPAGIPHRLLNHGSSPFRFLVIKTPRPVKVTKILEDDE
ncbi:MAG: cupin domain-containing protein [bacterium]